MKKLLLPMLFVSLLIGSSLNTHATDVSGVISTNTTWYLADSPYVVTTSVAVNPGITLTIEAGVEVKFNSGTKLQIGGTLLARGTAGSMIRFTSNEITKTPGFWDGIAFVDDATDATYSTLTYVSGCIIEYCLIEYAGPAIDVLQSSPCIDHNIIYNNYSNSGTVYTAGIEASASAGIIIRNNLIISNYCTNISRAAGGLVMNGCTSAMVYKNVFYDNTALIYNGGSGDGAGAILVHNASPGPYQFFLNSLYRNTATGNTGTTYPQQVGAIVFSNLPSRIMSVTNNTLVENSGLSDNPGGIVAYFTDVSDNNFLNNSPYDVAYNVGAGTTPGREINAANNWWGTTSTSVIDEKIYDFTDNFDALAVGYSPWKTSYVETAPITPPKQVIKQEKPGGIYIAWDANPESDHAGYKIYYGSPTGYSYSNVVDVGDVTSYTLPSLSLSDEIAVTAYDASADGTDDIVEGNESWYVVSEEGLAISLAGTNVSCKGLSNGSIDLTTSNGFPPFTYAWSNGADTEDISGLIAGTYDVTVTDSEGFEAYAEITITEPDLLELSPIGSNTTCIGGSDGSAALTVTGGTPSYNYTWEGPDSHSYYSSSQNLSSLSEGKYYINVSDQEGCTAKDSVTIGYDHELPTPVITFSDSNKICDGDSLLLDAGAGYTGYSWTGGLDTQTIYAKTQGTYTATVTDVYGCVNSDDQSVIVYSIPTSTFTSTSEVCGEDAATLTYTGDGSAATFDWMLDEASLISGSGQGPLSVNWDSPGTKTVSLAVTENGCTSDTSSENTEVYQVPTSDFTMPSAICNDGMVIISYDGNATVTADYTWDLDGADVTAGSGQGPLILTWPDGGDKAVSLSVTENGCVSDQTVHNIHVAYPFNDEEICLVTVDEATGKNMVVWERTPGVGTASYKIYREGNLTGVYDLIANVPYDNLSEYVDMTSIPEQQQYLYKISAVDTCGIESDKSFYHKTLLLQFASSVGGVNLNWQEYAVEGTPITFASYIIYRGNDSTALAPVDTISGSLTAYTDLDPVALTSRYFYRIAGVKSVPCNPDGARKAGTGPYHHSLSNLDNNRLQATPPNNAPTDISISNLTVQENEPADTLVGRFTTTDADIGDTHVYSLVAGTGDDDNASFTITGDSLMTAVVFDYETKTAYSILVRSTDDGEGGLNFEKSFTVAVLDKDETGLSNNISTELKIYPNPSGGNITIEFPNPDRTSYQLTLTDLSGKIVRIIDNIRGSEVVLLRGTLDTGYYIVEISGKKVYRGRLVFK